MRPVTRLVLAKPTLEGAGPRLHRAFGLRNRDRVEQPSIAAQER